MELGKLRLDKFLTAAGVCSRREAQSAAKGGAVTVNGRAVKAPDTQIDPETDEIVFRGQKIVYREFVYVMLNKPTGVVSATEDKHDGDKTVVDLLSPELQRRGLFPSGRLDKNTTGLILLTDDGQLSHRLLAPKSHVAKSYRFSVKFPLSGDDIAQLEKGVDIGGYVTAPCKVRPESEKSGVITITEGKYHQIKLMMGAVHNQITALERITFGPLALDPDLEPGEWRYLTKDEEIALKSVENSNKL